MTTSRRIPAAGLVLFSLLFFQSAAKTTSSKKYPEQHQDDRGSVSNQSSETTVFPVNPYVFSAEDYDILQDAESLQKALSIVAYEPQKLDPKKSLKDPAPEKLAQSTTTTTTTSQLPPEKKYYEVPRKQSRTRADRSGDAANLAAEASTLRQRYQPAPDSRREPREFKRRANSSLSTSLPVTLPPTTARTPGARNSRHAVLKAAVDQSGSESTKSEVNVPTVRKRRRKLPTTQEPQASLLISKDRLPRPFSLPTASSLQVTEPLAYASRPVPARQQTPEPTLAARQSALRPTAPVEEPAAHPSVPLRQRLAPYSSRVPEQASPFSTVPYATVPFAAAPLGQEAPVYYPAVPAKQKLEPNPQTTRKRPNRPPPRHEEQTKLPSTLATSTQQQPIVYNIPRRRDRTRQEARTTPPTRPEPPADFASVPTTQELPKTAYATPPARVEPTRRASSRWITERPPQPTPAYTAAPIEALPTRTNVPPALKQVEQNLSYEDDQDVAPPTLSAEYPTATRPGPVPTRSQEPDSAKSNSDAQENSEYKEYGAEDGENDYTEGTDQPASDDGDEDEDKKKDRKHGYNYSYVERIVEPEGEPAYKVIEEFNDYPEQTSQRVETYPTLQRGAYKRVEPDYYQDRDSDSDSDYDQTRGQNVQNVEVVAEARQEPKPEEQDVVAQADHHHHKKHHEPKKEHHEGEEGGADEHHEKKHHEHGEKGHKGYKELHEHDEGKKGHHDKEGHDHHYDEKEGKDKKHHDEAGYHEEHKKGEVGEKKHAFSEKGKHKKGHSTKGEHVIHKKDEYEKKTEFFDEFHEDGDHEKEGGHHEEHHHKKGGHHHKGHQHKGHHEHKQGEKGHHDKGHHHHEKKGHDEHEGGEHHHHHEEKYGKKGGHEDAKHWHHKKADRRR